MSLALFPSATILHMEIDKLVKSLRDEHKRLGEAIAVLEGLGKRGRRGGARRMSAAGRARIAAAQRKRWRLLKQNKA
jgi:hypothetical protein